MWNWEFAISIFPEIVKAMKITIGATIVGFILAAILGMFLAIGRRSELRFINIPTIVFIEFVRSTPLLVQLYFLYFVFPKIGITLPTFFVGVIGLGMHYSTYLSEVYRSGIDSIPTGQWEASTALNFSKARTWFNIIIPQAIPPVIPVMGNYLIVMFKETPLLSAITLVEMLQTAKIIGSQSFRYIEAFTIVGLLFFVLSYVSSILIRKMEVRLNHKFGRQLG